MCASSSGDRFGWFSGAWKPICQKISQRKPIAPMMMNATCQPNDVAISTVTNEIITPTFVPELNSPVASARSRCGNHWPIALIEAGKFPASKAPRKNRATTNPIVPRASAVSMDITDQPMRAMASPNFTPFASMIRPAKDGNAAYAAVNANWIHP